MTLLSRYVLRDVLQIFLLALTALTLVMLLVGVGKEALTQGLGPIQLLQLFPYLLPNALLFAIPGTILLSVSLVYGRMSNFGELIALKSLGISPIVVIWPTLVLATLLSFVTVWLNDVAVSWGYNGVRTVVINGVEDIIYSVLRANRSYTGKTFSVSVKRVDGKRLILPVMSFAGSGDMPSVTITAEEAEFRSTPGSGILTVICRNGDIEVEGSRISFPDEIEREIRLDDASGKGEGNLSPAHLSMVNIPERVARQRLEIERGKQVLAATAAYRLMAGEFSDLGGSAWANQAEQVSDQYATLHKLRTEPPRRWANGFSCLFFALVGIPLAIRLKNADMLTSFFACFGPILVIYYPLLAFGLDRSKAGALPPMIVWLANGMMAVWGLWLLRRVIRY